IIQVALRKSALQILSASKRCKSEPAEDKKRQIPILVAQRIIESSGPFRTGMTYNTSVEICINPVVAIQVRHANVAGPKRMSIRIEFFHYSEVFRCVLPNPHFFIVVVNRQPLTDKPSVVDIVDLSIRQLDNPVIARREIERRCPREVGLVDIYCV